MFYVHSNKLIGRASLNTQLTLSNMAGAFIGPESYVNQSETTQNITVLAIDVNFASIKIIGG